MQFLVLTCEYFGKFPHHATFPFMNHVKLHEDMQPIQLGGEELYSLHIHFHDSISSPSLHLPFTNIYFPMILCCTLLPTQYWHASLILQKGFLMHIDSLWFPVSVYIIIEEKRTENKMNVVNTRTNILCIHGCHTRTNHKKM